MRFLSLDQPPPFEDPARLRSYLWKAAHNLLLDRVRRPAERRALHLGSCGSAPEPATTGGLRAVGDRERSAALAVALQLLRPADREILERVYLRGQDLTDAARELAIEYGAAKMRLVRARDALFEKLKRWSDLIG